VALSRRITLLAATTATAVIGALAGPLTSASAADPISGTAGPTLTAPTDDHRVVLSWTPSAASLPYATGYELQISPNADWTNDTVTLPNDGITSNTTFEVPISLPHGYYFWRVRAIDAAGHSNWSAVSSFLHDWSSAMTLLKAPDSNDPSIAWEPVPGASLYRVRYSVFANFPPDPAKTAVCWTASTSFTPYTLTSTKEALAGDCMKATDILEGLNVYWDVRAWDDSTAPRLGADTEPDENFDCATAQPECDTQFLFDGTFTWHNPVAGAASPTAVTGLTTTWHTTSLPGNTCTGTVPDWCPVTPTFSWDPVDNVNYYEVTVYRDPQMSNVYRSYATLWPSLTPRDAYLDAQGVNGGNGYYWTVTAETCENDPGTDETCGSPVVTGGSSAGGGSASPTLTVYGVSALTPFDKRSGTAVADPSDPAQPSGFSASTVTATAPADDSLTNGATGTFKWTDFFSNGGQSAFDVRNYRVQIASDDQFDDVVLDVPTIDDVQFTPQVADLADGDYYWRVQPIDESGNGLAWSNVMHFTRDATPPVFTLTDGGNQPIIGAKFHVKVSEPIKQSGPSTHFSIVPVVPSIGTALSGTWSAQPDGKSWIFTSTSKLTPGQSYAFHLTAGLTDFALNPAKVATHSSRATVIADDKGGAWSFPSGTVRHSSSGALGGTFVTIPSTRAASVKFVGNKISVYGCKAPGLAKLVIRVDSNAAITVNEHQSFTKCGVLLWSGSASSGAIHTLTTTASGGAASVDLARTA